MNTTINEETARRSKGKFKIAVFVFVQKWTEIGHEGGWHCDNWRCDPKHIGPFKIFR